MRKCVKGNIGRWNFPLRPFSFSLTSLVIKSTMIYAFQRSCLCFSFLVIILLCTQSWQKKPKKKKKSALWHLELSQKVRAQFEWASQNTWSETTNKGNLSVSFTLNFSSSSYETLVRYAINLQASLIWRKCFRDQEGLVIHYAVLPKSRPHIRASLNHLTASSME